MKDFWVLTLWLVEIASEWRCHYIKGHLMLYIKNNNLLDREWERSTYWSPFWGWSLALWATCLTRPHPSGANPSTWPTTRHSPWATTHTPSTVNSSTTPPTTANAPTSKPAVTTPPATASSPTSQPNANTSSSTANDTSCSPIKASAVSAAMPPMAAESWGPIGSRMASI